MELHIYLRHHQVSCRGCRRMFNERGLRVHQSYRFNAMGCRAAR